MMLALAWRDTRVLVIRLEKDGAINFECQVSSSNADGIWEFYRR